MADSVPNHVFKLALSEDIVSKSMVKLLADFNIHGLSEEKAMKLFYSMLAHVMYYLDTHPGQYFKLNFIDITSDKDSLINVKRSADYTDDTVNATMFYNRYCGTQVLKEELQNTLDLFAQSFLGIKATKQKEKANVDELIRRRHLLMNDIEQCTLLANKSKKQQKDVLAQRKANQKALKSYASKRRRECWMSTIELLHYNKSKENYTQLESELQALWQKDENANIFEN